MLKLFHCLCITTRWHIKTENKAFKQDYKKVGNQRLKMQKTTVSNPQDKRDSSSGWKSKASLAYILVNVFRDRLKISLLFRSKIRVSPKMLWKNRPKLYSKNVNFHSETFIIHWLIDWFELYRLNWDTIYITRCVYNYQSWLYVNTNYKANRNNFHICKLQQCIVWLNFEDVHLLI